MEEMPKKNGVETLKQNLDTKQRVIEAATYAIQETSLLHKLGPGIEKSAIQAVTDEVNGYQGPAGETMSDVRNMARDAAEGVFLQFGFDQPEIMKDFDVSMSEQVEARKEPV